MAIAGFDYKGFSQELASQAGDLLPAEFEEFQKQYVINTIKNFATLCGEAIYNDTKLNFTAEQGMLITQIIAEWSFHKSVDLVKAGILPDYWDATMQKIAFTIFEIGKQAIVQGMPQDEILKTVEHQVKKTYAEAINDLRNRNIIDEVVWDRALHQSNIDEMMHKMSNEQQQTAETPQANTASNAKILKLATVALLLKQISQDKVQTILNKFNPQDAQTVIQYMQMPDLETKIDADITMKCLREIKSNLPAPKFISPNKLLAQMAELFKKVPKENIDRVVLKERPNVKEFINKAREGEYFQVPSKVANIIVQHLEESIS